MFLVEFFYNIGVLGEMKYNLRVGGGRRVLVSYEECNYYVCNFVVGDFDVVFVGGVYEVFYYIVFVFIIVSSMMFLDGIYVNFCNGLLSDIVMVVLG